MAIHANRKGLIAIPSLGAGLLTPPECLTEGLPTLLTGPIEGLLH
jgi:hypothetical protein